MSNTEQIQKKQYAIKMLELDVWGSSAYSNCRRIDGLEREIANLEKYGVEKPNLWQRVMAALSPQPRTRKHKADDAKSENNNGL